MKDEEHTSKPHHGVKRIFCRRCGAKAIDHLPCGLLIERRVGRVEGSQEWFGEPLPRHLAALALLLPVKGEPLVHLGGVDLGDEELVALTYPLEQRVERAIKRPQIEGAASMQRQEELSPPLDGAFADLVRAHGPVERTGPRASWLCVVTCAKERAPFRDVQAIEEVGATSAARLGWPAMQPDRRCPRWPPRRPRRPEPAWRP